MSKYEQAESAYQKQVKSDFSEALAKENLEWLDGLIDGLVKSYKKVLKMPKLENESLYHSGPIKKSDVFSEIVPKLKNQTLCQSPEEKRKQFGIKSLKIFNLQNSKGQTAVMLAAKHGRNDLLEKRYCIPDQLTDDIFDKEGREGVYEQRVSSYVAQDNEGYNALMHAIKSGHSECFPLLLSPETAIILNQKCKDGKTALIHAIESKNVNLIKKFISVAKEVLGGVNRYYPERKVKLEICSDTSKCIEDIQNEDIKSLVTKFIGELKEHISMPCKISLSLKRKAEQANGTPEKKRKEDRGATDERTQTSLRIVIEFDCKTKGFTGPFSKKIDKFKKYTNYEQLALNRINKMYCKSDNLEKKRQKVGQFLLKKLLHEADSSNLTSDQKEEILSCIKNLVIEAKIEFPEDLVQAIQMPDEDMRSKIFDIITQDAKEKEVPSSHLHSTINSLAGS